MICNWNIQSRVQGHLRKRLLIRPVLVFYVADDHVGYWPDDRECCDVDHYEFLLTFLAGSL